MNVNPYFSEIFEVIRYKELLRNLVIRDIKVRYKRSVLGFLWVMLNPLLMMLILSMVFSGLFNVTTKNYTIYLLSGIILWNFFSQSTSTSMLTFLSSGDLIKKIYVPKTVFPLSVILSAMINFLFSIVPLFLVMYITDTTPGRHLYVIPLVILSVSLFAFGISLILSTLMVFFHDTKYIYEVFLMAWMYATPIFYPESIVPIKYQFLLHINPFYYLLRVFRAALYLDIPAIGENLLIGFLFSTATFLIGLMFYSRYKDRIIYHL